MHQTFLTETRMCIHALEETYSAADVRVNEHYQLAEAIRIGDADWADKLLLAHMDDAIARLINR
jgi:DNA-binding GntR family transcriptional regulator